MDISDLRSRTFEHTAYTASVLVPWCGTVPVAHTKIDKIQNDNAIIDIINSHAFSILNSLPSYSYAYAYVLV